jgi:hypothetical protein
LSRKGQVCGVKELQRVGTNLLRFRQDIGIILGIAAGGGCCFALLKGAL